MGNSIFISALVISIVYILFKFLEMRLILKESKPLKFMLRDGILVYFSVIIGYFVIQQMEPLQSISGPIAVFTDSPDF
jgi:membrane protein YdbS with pleckstrin-like domain|tara:strand:+ start:293 stop:526 length:234 start_codon:yes stop_codon:yes gene_type:complete